MWLMLQQEKPGDYVVATGRNASIREFCALAFAYAGLEADQFVRSSQRLMRPAEVEVLLGNAEKIRKRLGWEPETSLETLVAEMVEADLARHKAKIG
jgi:GDPmannose 4,6-dehydratase